MIEKIENLIDKADRQLKIVADQFKASINSNEI